MNLDRAEQLEAGIDEALARGDLDRAEALAQQYRRDATGSGAVAASPRFRAAYLAAQVALAAGRLREAGRRLTVLLPPPTQMPDALACRIWLMSAETLARLHRLPEARGHLERALAFPEALKVNPLLKLRELRVRLWLGEVGRRQGDVATLAAVLEARGDEPNLALLRCEEGRAWDAEGRLDRARECWTAAERISRGLGADPIRADVLIQLGRLDHLHGDLQGAMDQFDAAAACSPIRWQRLEAGLRRLLVLLDLNQPAQARAELERLAPADDAPDELQPLVRMARALVHHVPDADSDEARGYEAARRGDLAAARELYNRAAAEAVAPVRRARLALALGLLAVAAGDAREAAAWLGRAEELARRHDLAEVLWRCLAARGQLAAESGDDEQARELLEEAVVHSEGQHARLRHRADAAAHGLRRAEVLDRLLLAACRRGDAAAVFRHQETRRGRLLLELWRAAPARPDLPRLMDNDQLQDLDRRIAACTDAQELQRLLFQRDRLFDEHLRDRTWASAALPPLAELTELEEALPAGTLYVAAAPAGAALYLLVCQAGRRAQVVPAGALAEVTVAVDAFRRTLDGQLDRYRHGLTPPRAEIDARLEDVGGGPLGEALWRVLDEAGPGVERLLWVPDGVLHGLPVAALRRGGRYLVERFAVAATFGGSLFVHQAKAPRRRSWLPRAVVLTEAAQALPGAAAEGAGVAAAFWRSRRLHGPAATRAALRRELGRAAVVHLACHAYFDAERPLQAHVGLPSGERWHALEWLDEPLDGLPLVTLSACRSAEVSPLVGREVFGLVTGLLGAGVRGVLAGLWPLADRETLPLMWRFYRHRIMNDVPTALALAQRESLRRPDGSPLYWAALGYFGDPAALPPPGRWWRWLARWRQARHARRFADAPTTSGS